MVIKKCLSNKLDKGSAEFMGHKQTEHQCMLPSTPKQNSEKGPQLTSLGYQISIPCAVNYECSMEVTAQNTVNSTMGTIAWDHERDGPEFSVQRTFRVQGLNRQLNKIIQRTFCKSKV